jgi:hypothetical protein
MTPIREKLVLIVFGSFIGGIGALCFWLAWPWIQTKLSPATNFESVEDLQKSMLAADQHAPVTGRSVDLRDIVQPHPKMEIMYDLRPGISVQFQRQPVRINSCGMRGPERKIAKADHVYRIALLGDSFAFGWGVKEEAAFASVLERVLQGYVGDALHIEVLNFGVPGYSTFQQVASFEEKGLDFQPDLVLVYFIDNDFALPFFIRDTSSLGQMITAPDYTERVSRGETDEQHAERRKLENLVNPNRWLLHLLDLGKKAGFPVYLSINPRSAWKNDLLKLWAVRQDFGLQQIKLRGPILRLIKERNIDVKDLSLKGDPHPSALKHQLLGEVLAASLFPEVRRSMGE